MQTESRRTLADKRMTHLASERARMDPLWMELRDAFLPHRGRFTTSEDRQPHNRRIALLNPTPVEAAGILASGLHAGLTSPARPWQKSAIQDDDLAEYGPVKEWLAEVDRRMMMWYAKSNLYQALPFMYAEYGTFGTMAGLVLEDPRTLFRVEPYTVGQYALARSERGEYDTMGREFTMTVRQIVARFGESNVSPDTRAKWNNPSQREQLIDVMHLIEPDGDGFVSCYYEKAVKNQGREGLLRRAAFAENPILAASWEYVGNEPYACGCPGMKARGAARALQIDEKDKSRAIQRSHNPPMQGPAINGINLAPGSYTAVTAGMANSQKIESVYDFDPKIEGLLLNIERRERAVRGAYFVDLFLMLTLDERNQRATAEEIRAKYDEKVLALGPTLEQANSMLRGLHARVFGIMARRSAPIWSGVIDGEPLLPAPPRELVERGVEVEPEFVSALQQAQRAQTLQGLERFASAAAFVAEFTGAPPEKFDADQYLDEMGAGLGVPPSVVRDDEEVAAMRQAAQQARQAEQVAQMAPAANQMASAVKSLAETRPAEGGLLDRLAGTM